MGCHTHTIPEVLVSYVAHARAALTAEGCVKIARRVVHDGWP